MWQRFTQNARQVVFYAQEEAQHLSQGYVGTEHVLLGITRMPDCRAAHLLRAVGVDIDEVRRLTRECMSRADSARKPDYYLDARGMSLTPQARRGIEIADEEARRLDHRHTGSEHLLLGLRRGDGGIAVDVLEQLGVDLEKLRRHISGNSEERTAFRHTVGERCAACVLLELMIADPTPLLSKLFALRRIDDPSLIGRHLKFQHHKLTASLGELMTLAHAAAVERGEDRAGPDHMLLAILCHGDNFATGTLADIGIHYEFVAQTMAQGEGT